MIKLILSVLLAVAAVNSQVPNGIMWVDHDGHQQHPIHHHHIQEQARDGEEMLGTPLIGLKLAKPFGVFGLPGLRHSSLNIGRIGGFGYANSLLGSENPNAAEDSQLAQMPQQENAGFHHHHWINQADSQLGNAHHYAPLQAAPQHYTPYQANLGSAPCSCAQPQQNYNLGAPMDPIPMGPMQPIIPQVIHPEQMVPSQPPAHITEQRTWSKGYGKGYDKGYG